MYKSHSKNQGFSLIEIMVVIVIIGLMVGVVAPSLMGQKDKGALTRVKADFSNIKIALNTYELENYRMPTTEQGLEALVTKTDIDPVPRRWPRRGYLERLPNDPWQRPYVYLNDGDEFELYTLGRDGQPGGEGADSDLLIEEVFE